MNLLEQMAMDAEHGTPDEALDYRGEDLVELGEELVRVKEELDNVTEAKKVLQERYDELRKTRIPEAMAAAGLRGSFTLVTGHRLSTTTKTFANVKAADREQFHSWLREVGADDLIKESVNAQTLSAFARERLENGDNLPPIVQVYTETTVSITKPR